MAKSRNPLSPIYSFLNNSGSLLSLDLHLFFGRNGYLASGRIPQAAFYQAHSLYNPISINRLLFLLLPSTVLLLDSSRFSHEFGHHASREANVTWQKLAAACICLAQYSAYQFCLFCLQKRTAKVLQMRETGGLSKQQHGTSCTFTPFKVLLSQQFT